MGHKTELHFPAQSGRCTIPKNIHQVHAVFQSHTRQTHALTSKRSHQKYPHLTSITKLRHIASSLSPYMSPTMNVMNNQEKLSSLALNTSSEQRRGQSRTSPLVRAVQVGAKVPSSVTSAPIKCSLAHEESPDLIGGTSRPTLPSTIIQSAYGWFVKRIETLIPRQPVSFACHETGPAPSALRLPVPRLNKYTTFRTNHLSQ